MYRRLWRLAVAVMAIAILGWVQVSRANTILVEFDQSASSGTSFVYNIKLTNFNSLRTNASPAVGDIVAPDYFSIYDFAGLQSWSYAPIVTAVTWNIFTQSTDPTAAALNSAA